MARPPSPSSVPLGRRSLVDDPVVALLLVLGAGVAGVLIVLGGETPSVAGVAAATRSLRAVVIAGALTIGAAAWLARPLGALALEPAVFGVAYLAMVAALAVRAGVVPFHLWLARLADSAPPAALPVFAVWIPVVLAVVVLGWIDRSIAPILVPLETERAAVLGVGLASLALGSLAAWLVEDLVHLAVYVVVAEAGIALLALTVFDPAVWQPLRSWLVALAVAETGLFGWVAAARARTGSRRVNDLSGVLVEARLVAAGLVAVALGAVGLPGWPIWDARVRIVELAVGGGLGAASWLVELLALLPFLALLRIGVVGVGASPRRLRRGPRTGGESGGAGGRRFRPLRRALRAEAALGPARLVGRRAARTLMDVVQLGAVRAFARGLRSGRHVRRIEADWRVHRVRVAAVGVLVLGVLALAGSAGWLGIDAAAAGAPPSLEQAEPIR